MPAALRSLLAAELDAEVAPGVARIAAAVRERLGGAVVAILFYGSCLRDRTDDGVIDFYVIVEGYRGAYGRAVPAVANALVPPNVYFTQVPRGPDEPGADPDLRCKYAVVSSSDLASGTSPAAGTPALWARLSQPCALVHVRDPAARAEIERALAAAVTTLLAAAAPLAGGGDGRALWVCAYGETFRTELRAEKGNRPELLYETFAARYDRIAEILADDISRWRRRDPRAARRLWRRLRIRGRAAQVLRLAKATFTFAGGLDYILWKVKRHSGVALEPTPWQRRHPLLAAPVIALRLYRRGGFR